MLTHWCPVTWIPTLSKRRNSHIIYVMLAPVSIQRQYVWDHMLSGNSPYSPNINNQTLSCLCDERTLIFHNANVRFCGWWVTQHYNNHNARATPTQIVKPKHRLPTFVYIDNFVIYKTQFRASGEQRAMLQPWPVWRKWTGHLPQQKWQHFSASLDWLDGIYTSLVYCIMKRRIGNV